MSISTTEIAERHKAMYRAKVGIGHYESDYYYESEETIEKDGRTFYPILIRFEKEGRRLSAVVPVLLKKVVTKYWPLTFVTWEYDYDAINKEAERIVRGA